MPPAERVAVFDNDGTLWSEKPIPIQLDFTLFRLAELAEADSSLKDRQPYKAAIERDYRWLGEAMVNTITVTTLTWAARRRGARRRSGE